MIRSIGLNSPVQVGFASGLWEGEPVGIPFSVVSNHTRPVPVTMDPSYATRAYLGDYPLLPHPPMELSSPDHHLIVVNRDTCMDYELYAAHRQPDGHWQAAIGVVFNLRSDALRPPGWASADEGGLPILPGLAVYGQVARGSLNHALRFTAPAVRDSYIYPARHPGHSGTSLALPPMGLRVRLKADVNISHFPYQARVVAEALKRYGMILADTGLPWSLSGAPDPHWNNVALQTLARLTGRDFEVVDTGALPQPGQ